MAAANKSAREKKTPLSDWHLAYGGRLIPYAGHLLPAWYTAGVIAEHKAVREKCGIFDVSHLGRFVLKGNDALSNLNYIMTNDFTGMPPGKVRYTLMCNEQGGIVDDMLVCKMESGRYMITVNAMNRATDFAWIKNKLGQAGKNVVFNDISDSLAQIALQGARAPDILSRICKAIPAGYYTLIEKGIVAGIKCIVSRTGYTGSPGFELFCAPRYAAALCEWLMKAGRLDGLIPCGIGARDTLRIEASMPLYGQELSEDITPFEAGLERAVSMDKDFIGRSALKKMKLSRVRTGLKAKGGAVVRERCALFAGGADSGDIKVGETSSGAYCPSLKAGYAMAMVDLPYTARGTKLKAETEGKRIEVEVVKMPFYKNQAGPPAGD